MEQERVEINGTIYQLNENYNGTWEVREVKFGGVLYELKHSGTRGECEEYLVDIATYQGAEIEKVEV